MVDILKPFDREEDTPYSSPLKQIISFTIGTHSGYIDEPAKTITVTMPGGTDVTSLAPVIAHTGASVEPPSGEAQDFSSPVVYTVTAADGSTASYTAAVLLPDTHWYEDGASPYTITTAYQIAGLAELVNAGTDFSGAIINLTANINLSSYTNWQPIGSETETKFRGTFNGNGNTITGLTIDRTADNEDTGLFGCIGGFGRVENLGIVGGKITGGSKTGSIAGVNNGTIANCYSTINVEGTTYVGGITGWNTSTAEIINCYNTGKVEGSTYVGGITGFNSNSITFCYNTGDVTGTSYAGGIVGQVVAGTVSNNISLGLEVTRTSGSNTTFGRIVGSSSGTLTSNAARSDMLVNGSLVSGGAGLDTVHGLSAAVGTIGIVSDLFTARGFITSAWDIPAGVIYFAPYCPLPTLKKTDGTAFAVTQNPTLPAHPVTINPTLEMAAITGTGGTAWSVNGSNPSGGTAYISPFKMGKYEVTQEQYQIVMGYNPSFFDNTVSKPDSGGATRVTSPAAGEEQGKRPVENVTWFDAIEFCNILSVIDGYDPVYTITGRTPSIGYPITAATVTADWTKNGYRLPTEAQWQYAAQGGASTEVVATNENAWYNANSGYITHEVGKKDANAFGLHDMLGNVWEWCWDWYNASTYPYPNGSIDPTGVDSGSSRVTRGGRGAVGVATVRSAQRNDDNPNSRNEWLGFRVVLP